MIMTMLAMVALLAPLPLVLLDITSARPVVPTASTPVEAFESISGCPVVPGRPS